MLVLTRAAPGPFSESQIDFVQTFADQAVIAIENVRLFEAEQQRTHELTESLEQQTATAEVLRVISSSHGDLQPVFESILANAMSVCEANSDILPLGRRRIPYRCDARHADCLRRNNAGVTFRPQSESPLGRMRRPKQSSN